MKLFELLENFITENGYEILDEIILHKHPELVNSLLEFDEFSIINEILVLENPEDTQQMVLRKEYLEDLSTISIYSISLGCVMYDFNKFHELTDECGIHILPTSYNPKTFRANKKLVVTFNMEDLQDDYMLGGNYRKKIIDDFTNLLSGTDKIVTYKYPHSRSVMIKYKNK